MTTVYGSRACGHHLPALQYIRGIAALGVAYVHAVQLLPGSEEASFFGRIFPLTYLGAAGVDMFFVLSGFLMFYLRESYAARGRTHFLLTRAVRIVPMYWLCTLTFAALLLVGGRSEFAPSARELLASMAFIPVLNHVGSYQPVLSVGWSLNHEVLFYLLFAVILEVRSPWMQLALLVVPMSTLVAFHYHFHLFEFLLGGAVYGCYSLRRVGLARNCNNADSGCKRLAWLGIVVVAIAMLATSREVYLQGGLLRFFAWGGGGALLLYLALALRGIDVPIDTPGTVINRWLNWLGDISYSLYLSHWIVGIVLHKLLARSTWSLSISLRISVVLLVSIVIGDVLHRLVERPFDRWLRTRLLARYSPTPVPTVH